MRVADGVAFGMSVTAITGDQLRVAPDSRAGLNSGVERVARRQGRVIGAVVALLRSTDVTEELAPIVCTTGLNL